MPADRVSYFMLIVPFVQSFTKGVARGGPGVPVTPLFVSLC